MFYIVCFNDKAITLLFYWTSGTSRNLNLLLVEKRLKLLSVNTKARIPFHFVESSLHC